MFNWGIIAPGRIAREFARGLNVTEDARLYAVASTHYPRAEKFMQHNSGTGKIYDSYQRLADDPAVDAVYIANPHRFHYENVLLCLEAGKPVLCEKPLTVTARESEQLLALAQDKNIFLMEGLWTRFLPVWVQVKKWLDEDMIGEVKVLSSTFGVKIPREPEDRLLNLHSAGGVLLDMGVYNVAMSQFVMGQNPLSIQSSGFIGETGVDERHSALFNYDSAVSQFTCSFQTNLENAFMIFGSKGSIRIEPNFWESTGALLKLNNGEVIEFDGRFRASGFEYEAEEVMRCIRAGKLQSDIMPWADTLGNMRIMDEMLTHTGLDYPFSPR